MTLYLYVNNDDLLLQTNQLKSVFFPTNFLRFTWKASGRLSDHLLT